jgi:hypothetical protein
MVRQMNAQEIGDSSDLRIQFGYRDVHGLLVPYAAPRAYDELFSEQPSGWTLEKVRNIRTTRSRHPHRAWLFTQKRVQLAAVEHETGLEIIGAIAAVVTIAQFGVWAYDRWWKKAERPRGIRGRLDPVIRRTHVVERFPNGRERVVQTLEVLQMVPQNQLPAILTSDLAVSPRSRRISGRRAGGR